MFDLNQETNLVVNWGQLFAMSAPWGVKFNQNALLSVESDFIKVGGNESFDWGLVPILWKVLREEVLLKLKESLVKFKF